MKLALCTFTFTFASMFGVGCSDTTGDAKTGPVAAAPLAGSIEGKSFSAKTALARRFGFASDKDDGTRSIEIYDTVVTCEEHSVKAERSILINLPWKTNTARDFSFGSGGESQTATFVIERGTEVDNVISTQGRVEIREAPMEKGATGTIRLRATAADSSVEGEISVSMCD